MKSDVKAVRQNTAGTIFAGRTRLRGIILSSVAGSGAGTVILQDNTSSTTLFQADCPDGDVFAFNIPEDGILFAGGIKSSTLTNATVTVLIDK
jgi:hypothetical protein